MLQIAMVAGYLVITTAASAYFSKKARRNTGAYYTAGGKMPVLVVATLLFSETIAGSSTIGNAANAFSGGLSRAIWANWGMTLGCILFVLTVSRFYRAMSEKYGAMTTPEAFAVMFGPRVRILMMVIIALVHLILYSTQAAAAANILSPLLGINETAMTWIVTGAFIVMTISGGMVSASWMGVVHSFVMISGMAAVAAVAVHSLGGLSAVKSAAPEGYFNIIGANPMNTIAGALGMAISFLASSNATNALFSARSEKTARRGILLSGLLAFVFALLPATIGICARISMPGIASGNALFLMSNSIGPVCGGLIAMAIIAAIWSTAPTLLLIISGTVTKDFYVNVIDPGASEKKQLRFSSVVVILAAVVGTLLGTSGSILDTMLGAFQIRSIVGIVLLVAIMWPRVDEKAAFWSRSRPRRRWRFCSRCR